MEQNKELPNGNLFSYVTEENHQKINQFIGLVLDDAIENKRINSESIKDISELINGFKP